MRWPAKNAESTSSIGPQVLKTTRTPAELSVASSGHEIAPQTRTVASSAARLLVFVIGSASAMTKSRRLSEPSGLVVTRTKHRAASSSGAIRPWSTASTIFTKPAT